MKSLRLLVKAALIIVILGSGLYAFAQDSKIDFFRPYSQDGVNVFETPKDTNAEFDKVRVKLGGNFAQQFQALSHSNTSIFVDGNEDGVNDNDLIPITGGFNLATANMNIDVQLDDGIRLNLVTYLSARHHPEAWVKGGYIQFDKLKFFNSEFVDNVMDYLTIKMGHMEVNYGDQHFRRTDNGNALYNPFVGNYIMDAFTTEIGGEIYFQSNGVLVMVGVTGGELKGDVTVPTSPPTDNKAARSPSFIGKVGYDKQVTEDLRVRATGSVYHTASSSRNFLYGGDRGGSRYYLVMEPVGASTSSNFTSGRYNPLFMDRVTAIMGNLFLQYRFTDFVSAELFGTYEVANGRMNFETDTRKADQIAGDLIFRLGKKQNVYLGGRYNLMNAEMLGSGQEISIDRMAGTVGWYINKYILIKGEYVKQSYKDFPETNILNGGEFDGIVIEAVVGF